jgi:hypothetical protein
MIHKSQPLVPVFDYLNNSWLLRKDSATVTYYYSMVKSHYWLDDRNSIPGRYIEFSSRDHVVYPFNIIVIVMKMEERPNMLINAKIKFVPIIIIC